MRLWLSLFLIGSLLLSGCAGANRRHRPVPLTEVRIGYQANLTHAQALLGTSGGQFEQATGLRIRPRVFPSGPASMAGLLAGEVDLLYVGPSPATTAFVRSEGKGLRIVAGGASGGALLVTRQGVDPYQLGKLRVATPGLANTQDIAMRHHLKSLGLAPREQGGNVRLMPMANSEILTLFRQGQLDAAWVPEPWASRLILEAGAVIGIDERELWPDGRFATTVVVVSARFLERHPEVVRQLLAAHQDLTDQINADPEAAIGLVQAELARLQGKPLPDAILRDAWQRIEFVTDPMTESVLEQGRRAYALGYLGVRPPDLSALYDLTLLKEADR